MIDKKNSNYWIKKFFFAFRGIFLILKEEKSMIFHVVSGIVLFIVSGILKISTNNWAIVVMIVAFVISIEFVNTAIENLVDMISFKYNFNARKIKDIAAAATLVVSTAAFVSSLFIFVPRVVYFVQHGYQ